MGVSVIQPGAIDPGLTQPDLIQPSNLSIAATVSSGDEVAAPAQRRWHAVYTCANREKRVSDQFAGRNVEYFLPQYEAVRRWKDRRVRLQLPLFPGYLFVHMAANERLRVLQVPGVVRLVGFNGSPTPMPEEDVNRIRDFLGQGWRAEPHPYLQAGKRARVVRGPLAGMEGIIVRRENRSRLVLSFDLIQRSMAIEMDESDLAAV
ncbi:MAG TPA: UpxY family transcription antiterminator [Candidatus Dormibacteraeota bacterium]|nr:UpxY family transcription antiterminator [Candidatus Dormibacteraeota bacterium]